MATATMNGNAVGAGAVAQVELTADMEITQALTMLAKGMVTVQQYAVWDAVRMAKVQAAAASERRVSKGVRITVSEKGMVVLNGVREKGEGFAPWFLPAEVAELCEHVADMARAVVEQADAVVAADAVVKDQLEGWKAGQAGARFGARPHGRRGRSALAWEGVTGKSGVASRDPAGKAAAVAKCKAFLAMLDKAKGAK